ncbi:MAG: NnrS family protein [Nitrososphaerales archaeon]
MNRSKMFIAVAIIFLILALLDGIFRLMAGNGISTGIMENIYGLHPILMVFGFLACIVMAERVAGIAVIPDLKKSSVPMMMVPLIALGAVSEVVGYTIGPVWSKYLGAALLFAGCLAFIFVLFRLANKTGVKLPFYFMIVSAVSLAAAAILSAFSLPVGNSGFIMLLLSFPLVFILGERVELTRFTSTAAVTRRFRLAFVLVAAAVTLFVLSSFLDSFFEAQMTALLAGSTLLLVTLFTVLLAESKNFKLLSKSKEPLQRYVFSHTRVAYAWGIFGVVLGGIYFASSMRIDLYDSFIHSIAVGFVGTMLLAHGPVILPSVTGRKLDPTKLTLLPLGILTAGNLIRVGGDLTLLAYNSGIIAIIVGLSGWLILIAVIVFLKEIFVSTSATRLNLAGFNNLSNARG